MASNLIRVKDKGSSKLRLTQAWLRLGRQVLGTGGGRRDGEVRLAEGEWARSHLDGRSEGGQN